MQLKRIPNPHGLILHLTNVIDYKKFQKASAYFNKNIKKNHSSIVADATDLFRLEYVLLKDFFDCIHSTLLTYLGKDTKLTGYSIGKNRVATDWHYHKPEYKTDPVPFDLEKIFVAIFYLHEYWDVKNGGTLLIGLDKSYPYASIPCIGNTCAIHSATLCHGVDWLNLQEAKENRIVMYSHWIEQC